MGASPASVGLERCEESGDRSGEFVERSEVLHYEIRSIAFCPKRKLQGFAPGDLSGFPSAASLRACVALGLVAVDEDQEVTESGQSVLRIILEKQRHVEDNSRHGPCARFLEAFPYPGTDYRVNPVFEAFAGLRVPEDPFAEASSVDFILRIHDLGAEGGHQTLAELGALQGFVRECVGLQDDAVRAGQAPSDLGLAGRDASQHPENEGCGGMSRGGVGIGCCHRVRAGREETGRGEGGTGGAENPGPRPAARGLPQPGPA